MNLKYNIPNLLLSNIRESLEDKFGKNEKILLPKKIEKYSLIKRMSGNPFEYTKAGKYKDKNGKFFFIKIWQGNSVNYHYISLKNESITYQSLQSVYSRISKNLPKKFKRFTFPKFVEEISTKNSLVLVTEWVDGLDMKKSNSSEEEITKTFFEIYEFLNFIGKKMNSKERKMISVRNKYSYFTLYPLLLVSSLILQPSESKYLLKGLFKVIPYFREMFFDNSLSLVHRDLHEKNIMISGKKINIVDLQFLVFTYQPYEISAILRYYWSDKKQIKSILDFLKKNYETDSQTARLFVPMNIIFGTHGMISVNFPDSVMKKFKDYLHFSVSDQVNIFEK